MPIRITFVSTESPYVEGKHESRLRKVRGDSRHSMPVRTSHAVTGLEELRPGAAVRGALPNGLVSVVSTQWFGSTALELSYKDAVGHVENLSSLP
jgi:hypothetical protein